MRVTKTDMPIKGMPNYYELYLKWWDRACVTGDNYDLQQAHRFARLAEEFGQAVVEEDTTQDDFFA